VRKDRKMRGFTLVELLIVLLILGILIGLAVPRYLASIEKAKETTFCSNVRNVVSAIEAWRMDTGTTAYPETATFLNNNIIQSASYFSQPPENPYTGSVLEAIGAATANLDNYFYYTATNNTYVIDTKPPCGLQ